LRVAAILFLSLSKYNMSYILTIFSIIKKKILMADVESKPIALVIVLLLNYYISVKGI